MQGTAKAAWNEKLHMKNICSIHCYDMRAACWLADTQDIDVRHVVCWISKRR